MEGRSDTQKGEGQLQGSPLRQVSEGVSSTGSQGWVHNGTPFSDGSMDGSLTESERSSESHQSQSLGQPQGEPGTVSDQRRSQEGGSWQVCGRCSKPIVNGWGTALKPAHEPIVVARKPLIGTIATNVLTYGTGALNSDGSRVGTEGGTRGSNFVPNSTRFYSNSKLFGRNVDVEQLDAGRWPANVIHDGSDEVLEYFGEPQRFFYCAKASKSERNAGLEGLPERKSDTRSDVAAGLWAQMEAPKANFHPTVKPIALMRYLVKLVTPPNGTVLDPFLGSGTTAVAAILEGFNWMGCEMTEDYWPIIEARVAWAELQPKTLL